MSFTDPTTGQPGLNLTNAASMIRMVIAILGGWLIGKGWITNEQLTEISGAAVILIPAIWAVWKNYNTHKALKDAIAAPAGQAKPDEVPV